MAGRAPWAILGPREDFTGHLCGEGRRGAQGTSPACLAPPTCGTGCGLLGQALSWVCGAPARGVSGHPFQGLAVFLGFSPVARTGLGLCVHPLHGRPEQDRVMSRGGHAGGLLCLERGCSRR